MKSKVFIISCAVLLLAGCNKVQNKSDFGDIDSSEIVSIQEPTEIINTPVSSNEQSAEIQTKSDYTNIDEDLTIMSQEMAYALMIMMKQQPTDYLGKVIKVKGKSHYSHNDAETDEPVYVICVPDVQRCCQQCLEYTTADGTYPSEGEEVTVVGVFNIYFDPIDNNPYCSLSDAKVSIAN